MEPLSLILPLAAKLTSYGKLDPSTLQALRGEPGSTSTADQMVEEIRRREALVFATNHFAPKPGPVVWAVAPILNVPWIPYFALEIQEPSFAYVLAALTVVSILWLAATWSTAKVMKDRRRWLLELAASSEDEPINFRKSYEHFTRSQPQAMAKVARSLQRKATEPGMASQ